MRWLLLVLVPTAVMADAGGPATSRVKARHATQLASDHKACDGGDAAACDRVGQTYVDSFFSSDGDASDGVHAHTAFEQACQLGSTAGCTDLGWSFHEGIAKKDVQRAEQLYKQSCDADDLAACAMLGGLYESRDSSVANDLVTARKLFERACSGDVEGRGCTSGCESLARWTYDGEEKLGIARDHAKALALEERSCNAGCIRHCDNAAARYRDGDGVAIDPAKAATFYQKVCDAGFAPSCESLGKLFLAGSGVKASKRRALQLFTRSCRLSDGHMSACQGDASGRRMQKALASCDHPAKDTSWICDDIFGFRKFGSIAGTVTRGGKPVVDVLIAIELPDPKVATTDVNGAFNWPEIPAGTYVARVVPQLGGGELAQATVTIEAGKQTVLPIVIR